MVSIVAVKWLIIEEITSKLTEDSFQIIELLAILMFIKNKSINKTLRGHHIFGQDKDLQLIRY